MIGIRCESRDSLRLQEMAPFQGELKSRTRGQLEELKSSISSEGLLAPFFVWRSSGGNWLLDGHARLEALSSLAKDDPSILEQDLPVVGVEAGSVDEAKKALLQITSQYGKVTKEGAAKFCASIPEYRAPAVSCLFKAAAPVKERAIEIKEAVSAPRAFPEGEARMVIAVPEAYVDAVLDLFNSVSYIRVIEDGKG